MATGNKTLRELEARIQAFRARTGGDYSCVWIAPERWALLPQAVREASIAAGMRRTGGPHLLLEGVPIRVLKTMDPEGASEASRQRAWDESRRR